MSWKEFFRLDKKHIIVFIMLVTLSLVSGSLSMSYFGDIQILRANGLFLILSFVFGGVLGVSLTHRFIMAPYTITLILFSIIYTYVASSIIVFIYDKFRKKHYKSRKK